MEDRINHEILVRMELMEAAFKSGQGLGFIDPVPIAGKEVI